MTISFEKSTPSIIIIIIKYSGQKPKKSEIKNQVIKRLKAIRKAYILTKPNTSFEPSIE